MFRKISLLLILSSFILIGCDNNTTTSRFYDDGRSKPVVAISSVILQYDGVNYTDASQNGNEWYKTFTDLAAGTHNYKWYANDTTGNWNGSFPETTYTVNKATPTGNLSISPSGWTQTYPTAVTISADTDNAGEPRCSIGSL